jgi:putative ABC transport system permease protein
MKLSEIIKIGAKEILSHKTLALVSLLGITASSGIFIYTVSQIYGKYNKYKQINEFTGEGRTLIRAYSQGGSDETLTLNDYEQIKKAFPNLKYISPAIEKGFFFENRHNDTKHVYGFGVFPAWLKNNNVFDYIKGRFITDKDIRLRSKVCVVVEKGQENKDSYRSEWEDMIYSKNFLGEYIRFSGQLFKVVGILKYPTYKKIRKTFKYIPRVPDVIFPLTSIQSYFDMENPSAISYLDTILGDKHQQKVLRRSISRIISHNHGKSIATSTSTYWSGVERQMEDIKRLIISAITLGGLTLFIGGIGIMNVILTSIYSRTKEIGIRRTIGATQKDIMFQFMSEAIILGLSGGFAGVFCGILGMHYFLSDYEKIYTVVKWWIPILAVLVSTLTALVFSIIPSMRASKLDPIESLKYE